jgi:outer membrane protein assembly factor BamE (lipoprotein component of BamABCDE complex)
MPGPDGVVGSGCGFGIYACFTALALASCVVLPVATQENKVLGGKPVSEEQLAFLAPKITTKREVLERLGRPNVIWEDARVFAYNWEMRQGILFWVVSGYTTGAAGMEDIPKHYLLLIQFDRQERVRRFARTVRPASKSYGEFLQEWLKSAPPE